MSLNRLFNIQTINIQRDINHYYYFSTLNVEEPVKAHIIGTGACAFHSDALLLHYQDFKEPNKADEQFSVFTKIQGVGLYIIPHKNDWIKNLDVKIETPALRIQTNWTNRISRYKVNLFPLYK